MSQLLVVNFITIHMSGKKGKGFLDEEEENDIGFRNPKHHHDDEVTEQGEDDKLLPHDDKEDEYNNDEEDGEDDVENFDDEEQGWHTFDMDNPDESL